VPTERRPLSDRNESSEAAILLIEDDVELCSLMRDYFALHGFRVEARHDAGSGLGRALEGGLALVILDVMLPVMDGFEVLRQLRARSGVPVIMLTARTAREDKIAGLNAGADDYLPKPFDADELLARVRAVLRRGRDTESAPAVVVAGDLSLDPVTRSARCGGRALELTSIEYDVLELLARSAGRIVSRDELAGVLYQRPASPYERTLDVHVSHVRKKLGAGPVSIRTVRGVGYVLGISEGGVE
jgi:two-component system, OmpR family, response regulator CpxR